MSEETVGEKEDEAQCQRRNEEEKAEPLSKLLRQKVIEVESLRKALSIDCAEVKTKTESLEKN